MSDREGLEALAPCPFCGCKMLAAEEHINTAVPDHEEGCPLYGRMPFRCTVESWNRRALLSAGTEGPGLREALETARDYIRDVGHEKNCDVFTTYGEMGCSCGYRERVFKQIDAALRHERVTTEVYLASDADEALRRKDELLRRAAHALSICGAVGQIMNDIDAELGRKE